MVSDFRQMRYVCEMCNREESLRGMKHLHLSHKSSLYEIELIFGDTYAETTVKL